MSVLVIDEQAKEEIRVVVKYATENPVSLQKLKEGYVVGDQGVHSCYINIGFRCVFSIEEQPLGWCKHLSVSIDKKGKYPNQASVEMIMHEFGIDGTINDQTNVWVDQGAEAPNVLRKIDDDDPIMLELNK